MTMNLFESIDLDAPVPIALLLVPRPPLVTRTGLTSQEKAIAEAMARPNPCGYLHPTKGWVSGGWPA